MVLLLDDCRFGERGFGRAVRLADHFNQGERDGHNYGAEHDSENAEQLQASQDREKYEELVQTGSLADQARRKEVVDRSDDQHAPRHEDERPRPGTGQGEERCGRGPHQK